MVIGIALCTTNASADEVDAPPEDSLKAALIYKIMAYVTWPDSAFDNSVENPFTVCGYGESPLGGALTTLTKRRAAGRSIELVSLPSDGTTSAICHLLFVDSLANMDSALSMIADKSVLTISDVDTFAVSGGMIEIRKKRNRFGFLINREAAVEAGLLIAAPLLELSTVVRGQR